VSEMQNLGVTDFISEIKRVENYIYPDFEKFAHVIQHGLQGFIIKISKVTERRQTILAIFIKQIDSMLPCVCSVIKQFCLFVCLFVCLFLRLKKLRAICETWNCTVLNGCAIFLR